MSFKALRRSRDAGKQPSPIISTPLSNGNGANVPANPILSKPASAKTFIPSKVIRAIEPRRGNNMQELSFSKGDFFYVIKDFDHNGELWYEVNNPVSGSRGIVPSHAFEELSKQAPTPRTPGFGISSPLPLATPQLVSYNSHNSQTPLPKTPASKYRAYLAIVQYDFQAERPDELDAKAGEAISVVAQSNREWFVAKPIGRLGGPGLIPVAFVELRNPDAPAKKLTEEEVKKAMDDGSLPVVEAWKKATMDYKQSSIPLGVIDPTPSAPPVASPYPTSSTFDQQQQNRHSSSHYDHAHANSVPAELEEEEEELLPFGMPISASIPSFHQESGEYWFRLDATYQPDPDDDDSLNTLPAPIYVVLYRNYDDFYAFQLALLDAFPIEAGRVRADPSDPTPPSESDRILPFMPGPVENVNDQVTIERKIDLNIYVHELIYLAGDPPNAGHILRSDLVRRFFSRKPGDVILDSPPPGARAGGSTKSGQGGGAVTVPNPHTQRQIPQKSHSQHSTSSNSHTNRESERSHSRARSHSNARSSMMGGDPNKLRMNGLSIHEAEEGDRTSRASAYSDYRSHRSQPSYAGDTTIQANGHYGRDSESPYDNASRASPTRSHPYSSRSPSASNVPLSTSPAPPLPDSHSHRSHHSQTLPHSHSHTHSQSQSAFPSSAPPPSASGPNSQFLKLKVFHADSDDLIAIRVSPRITYLQLLDKIRDRLGKDISELKYTPATKEIRERMKLGEREMATVQDDEDLREWVAENAKLVLYAY